MSPDWAAKPEDVPYAKMDDPQSLNLYGYVGNNPLSRADLDGHDWPTWTQVADFSVGVLRGAVSSATYGLAGAPSSSDSLSSLAGQSLGTSLTGGYGTSLVSSVGSGVITGLVAAPETGGAGLSISVEAVVGGAVGASLTAGATKNTLAIGKAMAMKPGSSGGPGAGKKRLLRSVNKR